MSNIKCKLAYRLLVVSNVELLLTVISLLLTSGSVCYFRRKVSAFLQIVQYLFVSIRIFLYLCAANNYNILSFLNFTFFFSP